MAAMFDRKIIRFMAGVECLVLAIVLMAPLMFPVQLVGAIGRTIVALMTVLAAILFVISVRLLYRRQKDSLDQPYVSPRGVKDARMDGESRLESKADTAKSFYLSDGAGEHFKGGGGSP